MLASVYPVTLKPPVLAATNAYENDAEMGRVLAYYFVSDSGGKGEAVIEHPDEVKHRIGEHKERFLERAI